MNITELPGFAEAVAKENFIRDAAFHELTERIGPFKVRAMTLLDWSAMRIAESPLLPPFRETSIGELIEFLWYMSPGKKSRLRKWAFKVICRRLRIPEIGNKVLSQAREYVSEALMDRPTDIGRKGYQAEYFSDMCSSACCLAREYGGGPLMYLRFPLKVIFQCFKEIQAHHIPDDKLMLVNPLSGRIVSDYLLETNRKMREAAKRN